ncbi:ssDNA endonuclease and repair protein rad10 [Friedmanniomyces endolithicus]|uniref:SsDNA endonuclease and repair protein rad10 n=1 Tax=Friedmanniomyces endolithicus TaxID=329885 RepID=A0AAN6HAN4_9PEZI|nr:ssDNA endonuclease and repair protein rad10 [Friedmanniomyces endolithicus]KAK0771283.1 ssDNA endonuclease and repair protein rad10 [Friedmanniomyces endolithicus]KAK0805049.1 ssDNA endonuclease and repair protein rad10 [Friedmanniomyces endolithicus]KAK0809708.1 ssDNA endonuclease and repair protein rad10 [Friedmanniomyces endolithicus]KAK0830676.1 ssDNA endonuclease and repair protein rad10 [Friedmanniomyces endolithicus]
MADDIIDDFSSIGIPKSAGATTNRPNGANASTSNPNGAHSGPKAAAGLDRGSNIAGSNKPGAVQPKPQALPKRSGPASIIVSPRQKGNPILDNVKSMPWEYGDIPADYVLGLTTCALFLSLKYHRLHPEYIYTRIKNLQGKYNLRIILTMVDIQNHEDSLKELSKTSLINSVTIVLCWSAAEGGRYLELFKTYENAAPTSIKQHQSTSYSDRMVDFITTPRSINKTDAVSLVSQFGTIRTAVNARHEDVATIAGWGEKKVQRWCAAVREPFRIKRAGKRGLATQDSFVASQPALSRDATRDGSGSPRPGSAVEGIMPASGVNRPTTATGDGDADRRPQFRLAEQLPLDAVDGEDEVSLAEDLTMPPIPPQSAVERMQEIPRKRKPEDDPLNDGVMAALSKLRKP